MLNKKGMGIVFNWIFVLIAGMIIFLFLVSFAFKYKALSEKKIDAEVALAIDNQLSALSSSLVHTEINPKGVDFFEAKFHCGGFSFENFDVKSNNIIFAPSELRSSKLLVWVDEWKVPFKTTNFIFISVPNVKYYFVADKGHKFVDELMLSIPREFGRDELFFNIERLEIGEVNSRLVDKVNGAVNAESLRGVRFVVFDSVRGENEVLNIADRINADVDVVGVRVDKEDGDMLVGELRFGGSERYKFLGRELLIGGIIANEELYNCNTEEALKRLGLVGRINMEKANSLWAKRYRDECQYALIRSSFDKAIGLADAGNIGELYNNLVLIEKQNKGLYGKGCLDIY